MVLTGVKKEERRAEFQRTMQKVRESGELNTNQDHSGFFPKDLLTSKGYPLLLNECLRQENRIEGRANKEEQNGSRERIPAHCCWVVAMAAGRSIAMWCSSGSSVGST